MSHCNLKWRTVGVRPVFGTQGAAAARRENSNDGADRACSLSTPSLSTTSNHVAPARRSICSCTRTSLRSPGAGLATAILASRAETPTRWRSALRTSRTREWQISQWRAAGNAAIYALCHAYLVPVDPVFVPRFFIHCAGDFTLEQEGSEDLCIFREIEDVIEQVSKLQRDADARLTVFDPHGVMIMDTLFPPLSRESAGG